MVSRKKESNKIMQKDDCQMFQLADLKCSLHSAVKMAGTIFLSCIINFGSSSARGATEFWLGWARSDLIRLG